ncbi:hypothetical protein SCLCIDRAFT_1225504 [Scleroderma citrinum Foug A]|uniref:Uncharacterized protein n=1 Tax=Scleroderma citrinum Foug A TaxID=1036808 RepID=A0A0C2ZAD4_9AGAM|nr:hypothetical protein SCLCIDRAFT_1225504 [Scleroderma citrinum Foug A]
MDALTIRISGERAFTDGRRTLGKDADVAKDQSNAQKGHTDTLSILNDAATADEYTHA